MKPEILYEDNHLLVVNKPGGLLTQGDSSGRPSLLNELKLHIKERDQKSGNVFLGMVQRLDKPVSGVIFFAKTSKAASRLSAEIRNRKGIKIYAALSEVKKNSVSIDREWHEFNTNLVRKKDVTVVTGSASEGSQKAILKVKVIHQSGSLALQLIQLITGRKHQIRAQLNHLGRPILGDEKYGANCSYPGKDSIALHACMGAMKHPVKDEIIEIISPLPIEFFASFDATERERIDKIVRKELKQFLQ